MQAYFFPFFHTFCFSLLWIFLIPIVCVSSNSVIDPVFFLELITLPGVGVTIDKAKADYFDEQN